MKAALEQALEAMRAALGDLETPYATPSEAERMLWAAIRSAEEALASPPVGYLRNCDVTYRADDSTEWLFMTDAHGNTYCQLDGYVIFPKEKVLKKKENISHEISVLDNEGNPHTT